jgi:hypothetical protein
MKLSDIFKQQKIASGETAIPEQFAITGKNFDATKCKCDLSAHDVTDMSDIINAMVPDSKPACGYCGHSAEDHETAGCGHGSSAGIASLVPLETTYLPHDGELGSARVLASALQQSGLSDANKDFQTIVSSMGNLEATHPAGELRRKFHHSVFNTIKQLMTSGRLPSDDNSGSANGLFNERVVNAKLLQDMAEHHGGNIMGMFDAYRKYAGVPLNELLSEHGIKPHEVSKKYLASQERADQAAQGMLAESTQILPTMSPDDCAVCSSNASTMGRLFQAYLGTMERSHPLGGFSGTKEAFDKWHQLEVGHVLGEKLPEDSHAYLIKAQDTLDNWRDSGHLYGDAHSRPDSMYFSRFPASLETPEIGSGERHSSWFDREYNDKVNGLRANVAFVPRNKRDETLSDMWKSLVGSHTGTEEEWLSTPGNFKKLTDLEDHLKSNGMEHIANRFIKREPILDVDSSGAHSPGCIGCAQDAAKRQQYDKHKKDNPGSLIQPPKPARAELHSPMLIDNGRQRITIDTGGHVITFIPGRRTLEGEQYTLGNFSRELPRQSVKLTAYGEAAPYYSDLERYIIKKGSDIDLDALTTTRVDPKKTISCRAKREEHTDEETGEKFYIDKAVIPSLVPEEMETGKLPEIQEHECDQHDGHLFDGNGNITHIQMKNSSSLMPHHKPAMQSLFEQSLEDIRSSDPVRYGGSREDLITNLGAEMDRVVNPDAGIAGRPRFSPGGERDLLGDTEQQIRSITPTEKQTEGKPPKKRTRKK